MNYFKRAMLSIKRRKGKSFILFLVIFILGNLMAGAISIQQGTSNVEENIKKKLGTTAKIGYDYNNEAIQDENFEYKAPTQEVYDEIGALPQVEYSSYNMRTYLASKKLKIVSVENVSMANGSDINYFDLRGTNTSELLDEKMAKIKIKDGRNFNEEELEKGAAVTIISDKFAKENNVKLGDKLNVDLVVENYNIDLEDDTPAKEITKDFPSEVVGIFEVIEVEQKESSKKDDDGMAQVDLSEKLNTLYFPSKYLTKIITTEVELRYENFPEYYIDMNGENVDMPLKDLIDENIGGSLDATFILDKPESVEDFKILGDQILKDNKLNYLTIRANSDQYDSIAGPIKGMAKISKIVLIVAVLASVFIITLVIILFLRDRKHELGIYLSLGEKKEKVVGQILIEVAVVALVAMTLSVFTGNVLAKSFSQSLINTQRTEDVLDGGMVMDYEYRDISTDTFTEDDVVEAYKISLTPSYIVVFYAVGLGVIVLSTIVPLVYIVRLNPKKIMM